MSGTLKKMFSWSCSRHALFRRCRLAYFLRYHTSWEGWDIYSGDETKKIYRMKKAMRSRTWLLDILRRALVSVLDAAHASGRRPQKSSLMDEAIRLFFKDKGRISCRGRKSGDALDLFEISFPGQESNPQALLARLEKELMALSAEFADSAAFDEISRSSPASFRDFRRPAQFHVGAITAWASPDLIWQDGGGKMKILKIHAGPPEENSGWEMQMSACALFAAESFKVPEERIEPCNLFLQAGDATRIMGGMKDLDEIRGLILDDASHMLEAERDPVPDKFRATEDKGKCASCEFAGACIAAVH